MAGIPHSYDVEKAAYRLAWLLDEMEEGEHLRIMTGTANRRFYETAEQPIRDAKAEKGITITMVAGPILWVADDGDSPILRMARDGVARLYVASTRPGNHFRVIGRVLCSMRIGTPRAVTGKPGSLQTGTLSENS
jgi:hypothetical protein